jgi:ornithine decarboxylase
MPLPLVDCHAQVELPSHWPEALHPRVLAEIEHTTPYLICDLDTLRDRYRQLLECVPGIRCFYALKSNCSPRVLQTLAELGSGFEVASIGELDMLQAIGIDPADVLYSNPVKPPSHIAAAHAAGLWRFAFDSEGELYKLARHAPGCAVYVRLRVDDSTSSFPLSRKFGAEAHEARALLLLARSLGLRPYGVTFHVGSQCTAPNTWRQAIAAAGRLLARLTDDDVELEMLNLSGGFPARYVEPVPSLARIADTIRPALAELLPYQPPLLAAEPGRYLNAESAVLVASVLGRGQRAGENWLYLDVGAYNGLIETQQSVNQWRFPLWSSLPDHAVAPQEPFTVTGPTCDSSDTMFFGAMLPSTLDLDDRVYIGSAGAYTLSYASSFNGFPPPAAIYVEGR